MTSNLHFASVRNLLNVVALMGMWQLAYSSSGFVQRESWQFKLDDKPFFFVGFNAYWLIEMRDQVQRPLVDHFFDLAKDLKLTVGRTWAFNYQMPASPNVYDETEFETLDYALYSAQKRGIKMILALGNLWNAYRGPEHYLRWATNSEGGDIVDFYHDSRARELYKQHIHKILNRRNTFTHVLYKDDPTIMAWDVLNEPRCPGCTDDHSKTAHDNWLKDMSAYVKQEAPQQLVTHAMEGIFNKDSGSDYYLFNPGPGAQCEGEDWVHHHKNDPNIDFVTLHMYERHMEMLPKVAPNGTREWFECDWECVMNWMAQWLELHIKVAREMQLPLVIEEFGITTLEFPELYRKEWYYYIFDRLIASQQQGEGLMGAMFWNAAIRGTFADDGYNVYLDEDIAKHRKMLAPGRLPGHSRHLRALDMELDVFRRHDQRLACATAAALEWLPAFKLSGVVDLDALKQKTDSKRMIQIIRETTAWL